MNDKRDSDELFLRMTHPRWLVVAAIIGLPVYAILEEPTGWLIWLTTVILCGPVLWNDFKKWKAAKSTLSCDRRT